MGEQKKIAIGSDHAGYVLKEAIKEHFADSDFTIVDKGCNSPDASVDYPDFAHEVSECILNGECGRGILICGTGIGMSMAANRRAGIRAALVTSDQHAKMATMHNNANILVFGAKITSVNEAKSMLKIWLSTKYEGGRHDRRLAKLDKK